MAVKVSISDDKINNLSADAQNTLKTQIEKYADDILKEANLIEEVIREDGASTEITSNIVIQAVRKNKNAQVKKSHKGLLLLKIISTLSLLVAGFLFDPNGYQNAISKLILFIVVLMVATGSTVAQFVLEGRD